MIKDNQKTFNKLHVIIDAVLIAGTYLLAYSLRFKILTIIPFFSIGAEVNYYTLDHMILYLPYLVPGFLIFYQMCGLYLPRRAKSNRPDFWNTIKANLLGLMYFITISFFVFRDSDVSRGFSFLFIFVNIIISYIFRKILQRILSALRRRGHNLKHVLLVGYSKAAESYIDRIRANPQWGYYVYGILDDTMEKGTQYRKIPVVGTMEDLSTMIADNQFDEIAITISISKYDSLIDIVKICEKSGIHTKFIPDFRNVIPTLPYLEDLAGLPVINIRNVPLTNSWNKFIKRSVDIFGSVVGIVLFALPMLLVAFLVKFTSPGPVLFIQTRVGLGNKEFNMYKFRSMTVQSDKKEKIAWTTVKDARVTGVGKFIRKTSLDELPQFFNVLFGNMSLVGPRPERPHFVEKFKEEIPRYMIKHQVRPGMTGWAQINGYRGDTSIPKRIEHDLYYVENWTLGFDIMILFLTIFRGFINRNAY